MDCFGTYFTHAQTCNVTRLRYILYTCPNMWALTKRSSNSEGRMVVHARRPYACLRFPHFSLRITHVFGHAYADLTRGVGMTMFAQEHSGSLRTDLFSLQHQSWSRRLGRRRRSRGGWRSIGCPQSVAVPPSLCGLATQLLGFGWKRLFEGSLWGWQGLCGKAGLGSVLPGNCIDVTCFWPDLFPRAWLIVIPSPPSFFLCGLDLRNAPRVQGVSRHEVTEDIVPDHHTTGGICARFCREAVGLGDFEWIADKGLAKCGAELAWFELCNVKERTLRVRCHHLLATFRICWKQVGEAMNRLGLNILLHPAVCPSEQSVASSFPVLLSKIHKLHLDLER